MNAESIKAVTRLVVTLICAICSMIGYSVDSDNIATIVASVLMFVFCIYSWWKNNNITDAAQEAQKILEEMKEENETTGI